MVENVNSERRGTRRTRYGVIKNTLYSTLRFIAGHVRGFYGALATFVTVSLIVGAVATALFAGFAALVTRGLTQPFDEAVLQSFEGVRSDMMNQVMLEVTSLGSG